MSTSPIIGSALVNQALQENDYLRLTPATNNVNGRFYNRVTVPAIFAMKFDMYALGSAEAIYFTWGTNGIQTSEVATGASIGYVVDASENRGKIEIRWQGTILAEVAYANLGDGTYRNFRAEINKGASNTIITVFIDDVEVLTYTDSNRTLPGTFFGVGARTGAAANAVHRIKNFLLYTPAKPVGPFVSGGVPLSVT